MLAQGDLLQGLGALPAVEAHIVLPPPRHTHVQCLVLLTTEVQEAAFPVAPLRATDACRSAAAAPASAGGSGMRCSAGKQPDERLGRQGAHARECGGLL